LETDVDKLCPLGSRLFRNVNSHGVVETSHIMVTS